MNPLPARGLYALLDAATLPAPQRLAAAAAALAGGAGLLQYRDKGRDRGRTRNTVQDLLALCREHGVALIVNDDVELAQDTGAHGVHLGADDMDLRMARRRLGPGAILGASCHGSLELAAAAAAAGADYLSFGRFFASATKPGAPGANSAVLGQAKQRFAQPIVAIGGVNADNGGALIAAGADWLCAAHGVFGSADPARAAAKLVALFETS